MIISASRRTDIPAFYGEWFIKRIEEGFFYSINPFNSKQVRGFSLERDDVDAFIFWTKNPKEFLKYLDLLSDKGYNYYFQFTLNDYPKIFEPFLPDLNERIETFINLSEKIGAEKVIWRYDPIILSTITPLDYHLEKINKIAEKLSTKTKRIIFSFLDFYGKVEKRLRKITSSKGIVIFDILKPSLENELLLLVRELKKVAVSQHFDIYTCSESINLESEGISHGSCIDGNLINEMFNLKRNYVKDKSQRRECCCVESIDIGVYNTCSHQCSYCYANFSEKSIINNIRKHRIDSPSLINYYEKNIEIIKDKFNRKNSEKIICSKQLSFFDK